TTMGEQAVDALLPPPSGANGHGLQGNSYEATGSEWQYLKKHGYYAFETSAASSRFTSPADAKVNRYVSQYPFETSSYVLANGWVSAPQPSADSYQWLEMNLAAGEYSQFECYMKWGLEVWVSIFVGPGGGWYDDKTGLLAEGWADPDGNGNTPLGTPFVAHFDNIPPTWVPVTDKNGNVTNGSTYDGPYDFGHDFVLPKGSKMRLTFGKLKFRDPTYDTAPPFPEGLWEKLSAGAQGFFFGQNVILNDKRTISADQKAVDYWDAMVSRLKSSVAEGQHFLNNPPSWWDDVMRGDTRNNIPDKTFNVPVDMVFGGETGGVLANFTPLSDSHGIITGYFGIEYDHTQIDRANEGKSWGSDPIRLAQQQLASAESQLDQWQHQLKLDQATLAHDLKAKQTAITDKGKLATLKHQYLEEWLKDTVHRPGYYAGVETLRAYRVSQTDPSVDVG